MLTQVVHYTGVDLYDHYIYAGDAVYEGFACTGLIFEEDYESVTDSLRLPDDDLYDRDCRLVGSIVPLILFINQETYEEVEQQVLETQA